MRPMKALTRDPRPRRRRSGCPSVPEGVKNIGVAHTGRADWLVAGRIKAVAPCRRSIRFDALTDQPRAPTRCLVMEYPAVAPYMGAHLVFAVEDLAIGRQDEGVREAATPDKREEAL